MTDKITTFADFVASRREVENLSDEPNIETGHDEDVAGFVYLDSYYIEKQVRENADPHTEAPDDVDYIVVIGNAEKSFVEDLDAAERCLWFDFVLCEVANFRPVRFCFGDDPEFDGYADGSTWNGFDNVRVTPDQHEKIVRHFRRDYERSGYYGDDLREVMEPFQIEPDQFGLIDYGFGFATQVVPADVADFYAKKSGAKPADVAAIDPTARFACVWTGGYPPTCETQHGDFFDAGRGYEPEHIRRIAAADVGDVVNLSDPSGTHIVVRLS